MIETLGDDGLPQVPWRPRNLYHYIQYQYIAPAVVVGITAHWPKKWAAIQAYKSQFFDLASGEPETYLSSQAFSQFLEARGRDVGHLIGAEFGEGFTVQRPVGVREVGDLL